MYLNSSICLGKKILFGCRLLCCKFDQVDICGNKCGEQHAATFGDVALVGPVVNLLTLSTAEDQVGLPQKLQVMRNGGLRNVEPFNQVIHAHFALILQNLQNALPGFIRHGLAKGYHIEISHFTRPINRQT